MALGAAVRADARIFASSPTPTRTPLPTATPTPSLDLTTYIPGDVRLQSWGKGQHTCGVGVRWVSSFAQQPDGSQWFRWDFSAQPSTAYDVMHWSAPPNAALHYFETRTGCTNWGTTCTSVTSFPDSIVFAPRFYTVGTTVTGTGTTPTSATAPPPLTGTCVGTNAYRWTVRTARPAGVVDQDPDVDPSEPVIAVESSQTVTWTSGPCVGTEQWEEHWFLGRVCDQGGTCGRTIIAAWGGPMPYATDGAHFAGYFDAFAPVP